MLRHIIEAQCRCMSTSVVLVEGGVVSEDVGCRNVCLREMSWSQYETILIKLLKTFQYFLEMEAASIFPFIILFDDVDPVDFIQLDNFIGHRLVYTTTSTGIWY